MVVYNYFVFCKFPNCNYTSSVVAVAVFSHLRKRESFFALLFFQFIFFKYKSAIYCGRVEGAEEPGTIAIALDKRGETAALLPRVVSTVGETAVGGSK